MFCKRQGFPPFIPLPLPLSWLHVGLQATFDGIVVGEEMEE
jgi:hypothetical protein